MAQTTENTLPITVSQQSHAERNLIEIGLVTGQKLYLNPGAARLLACDLIQAAYQAETRNQHREPPKTRNGGLSIIATA